MPNLEIHCIISRLRTGQEYKELHQWMDEGTKFLKHNHRLERHFYTEEYKDFITEKWGKKAVVEWLFHIALDNLETANKFAVDAYSSIFDKMTFTFKNKQVSKIVFMKEFEKTYRCREIDILTGKISEYGKYKEGYGKS